MMRACVLTINKINLAKGGQVLKSCGDVKRKIFPRSACKALQALACFEVGAHEKFQFTDEMVALLCASHNAEPEHIRVATEILSKINLTEARSEKIEQLCWRSLLHSIDLCCWLLLLKATNVEGTIRTRRS